MSISSCGISTPASAGARGSAGEPAWRKLERIREEKRTAGLLSDFDDYDVDETGAGPVKRPRRLPGRHR